MSEGESLSVKRSGSGGGNDVVVEKFGDGFDDRDNGYFKRHQHQQHQQHQQQQQQQSPRTKKKSDYSGSGLLSENRREVLDFTSTRKQSEQEKEQELERALAKLVATKEPLLLPESLPGKPPDAAALPAPKQPSSTQEPVEAEGEVP